MTHNSQYPISPRNVFKHATNNILWVILHDIVNISNLHLTFAKVKAHSGNHFNESVDSLAKSAHSYDFPLLIINPAHISSISYFPLWNNIYIEQHLRHFITKISHNKGMELWLNLYRNNKYRKNEIDWQVTLFALQDDAMTTSFYASNRKSSKIKFLIEELPTVEHMKKRRPDLYDSWNCPMCENEPETFIHIWSCPNNRSQLAHICYNNRKKLINSVNCYKQSNKKFKYSDLNHNTIWELDHNQDYLTFIDLVKGIVPSFLTSTINSYINNPKITLQILLIFLNNVYSDIMTHIWKPRCKIMLINEQQTGINKKQKRKKKPNNTPNISINKHSSTDNLALEQKGLKYSITFGGFWLDFYNGS